MALELAAITLTNPTKVTSTTQLVAARNMAAIGPTLYHHKIISIDTPKKIVQHILTIEWEGLGDTELATLLGAWELASEDYVQLLLDGLQLVNSGTLLDYVFVMSQASGLNITYEQGYTPDGEGPIISNVKAIFASQPAEALT